MRLKDLRVIDLYDLMDELDAELRSPHFDGYLEGEYEEIEGWQDLEIDAYIGDRPVEVDMGYIEDNLVR